MGYVGFEVARGCGSVAHEGGLVGAKNQKPSSRGSILASEVWVGWFLGGGYPNGVGYVEFEVAGGCDLATREGGPKTKNRAPGVPAQPAAQTPRVFPYPCQTLWIASTTLVSLDSTFRSWKTHCFNSWYCFQSVRTLHPRSYASLQTINTKCKQQRLILTCDDPSGTGC